MGAVLLGLRLAGISIVAKQEAVYCCDDIFFCEFTIELDATASFDREMAMVDGDPAFAVPPNEQLWVPRGVENPQAKVCHPRRYVDV